MTYNRISSATAKEWKPINIFFETDQENAVFKSTDKKGEKVGTITSYSKIEICFFFHLYF